MSQTTKAPSWEIWSSNGNTTKSKAPGVALQEPWNPAPPHSSTMSSIPAVIGAGHNKEGGIPTVTDTQDEVLSKSPQNGRKGNSPDINRASSPFLYRQRQATAAQAAALNQSPKDAFLDTRPSQQYAYQDDFPRLKSVMHTTMDDSHYGPGVGSGQTRSSSTPPFANVNQAPSQSFTSNSSAAFFTPQVPQRGFFNDTATRESDLVASMRKHSIADSVSTRFDGAPVRSTSPYVQSSMSSASPYLLSQSSHQDYHSQPYSEYAYTPRDQFEDGYPRMPQTNYNTEPVYGEYGYGYRNQPPREFRRDDYGRMAYDQRNRYSQDRRAPYGDYYRGPANAGFSGQSTPYYDARSGSQTPNYPQPAMRRDDTSAALRSALLEEFRNNKSKKYDLKDIIGHVVEFSGDQHGSRFIQQKLETATSDDKEEIFQEILPNCLQLMTDVFGNYVIQKFFEHGSQVQKTVLAKHMETHVLSLSLQMYGCRVVQKALEYILAEQQVIIIRELDGSVLKCVRDQNGNHVIQKALERVPADKIQFIISAFQGQAYSLATHPYGCRVVQRMLEYCPDAQASILEELHRYTQNLVVDQYGNYVSQHIIERGSPADRSKVIDTVRGQVILLSKHKFASNVVEKCIAFGNPKERRDLIDEVLLIKSDGQCGIPLLMKDQYGNYVLQKMLEVGDEDQRVELAGKVRPLLDTLKRYSYGKHLSSIERLLEL